MSYQRVHRMSQCNCDIYAHIPTPKFFVFVPIITIDVLSHSVLSVPLEQRTRFANFDLSKNLLDIENYMQHFLTLPSLSVVAILEEVDQLYSFLLPLNTQESQKCLLTCILWSGFAIRNLEVCLWNKFFDDFVLLFLKLMFLFNQTNSIFLNISFFLRLF